MDDSQTSASPAQTQEPPTVPAPKDEKKPEGIEHDPYEWGKCSITANIVWLPDGSVMLGVRNHLDAPLITLLSGDELVSLAGHAAELPIPTIETIANLLAQLHEDLPIRAQAKFERDEATRRKAEETKNKQAASKKNVKAAQVSTPATSAPAVPAKLPPVGKAPASNQISMFNFIIGG
jgi:hypothetical protein